MRLSSFFTCNFSADSSSTYSSRANSPPPHRHQHVDEDESERESEVEGITSPPRNLVSAFASLASVSSSSSSSSSSHSFFLLLLLSTLCSVFPPSISAARPLEMESNNNNNNNGEVWPMNVDGLFAAEQFGENIKPVSSLLTSSSSEFDFFSPLSSSSAARDSLAMAPDFNVMSATAAGVGAHVGWQSSSQTYYQVVQGDTINITSTLQVTDSAGIIVIPSYAGTVTVSITVPSSLGTLTVTPVSGLSFATGYSAVSTLTVTGNFAIVQKCLNSTLQFTASTSGAVGNATLVFTVALNGTTYTPSLIVNVQAAPTSAPVPTTALPTPAVAVVRIQFSLGNIGSSITFNSRGWTTQQKQQQPRLGHRFDALSTILLVGSAAFNTRLTLDICNVTNIAAVYCTQRIKVEETFLQSGVTYAVVDFYPLNTTGTSSTNSSTISVGPVSALALAQAFTSSASSWSTIPTLQSASVSTISFYCAYTNSYISADSCVAPSSSSNDTWWIPLVVILPFFFVLAIVIIAFLLVRKRRQAEQKQNTKTGTTKVEVELASRDKAPAPITTAAPPAEAAAAAVSSSPPPSTLPGPTTSSREEATTSSPAAVAVPVQGGQYAVVEPGLKFMYSAPDWEPEEAADSASGGGGAGARQDVHVHLDPSFDPSGTASPQRTMEDDNASRFSYVPKNN